MPLLEGLDGERKMSKSYGNYVGITETAQEMFGKLMSISDALMWRYYELLTDLTIAEIEALQADVKAGTLHPMRAKKDLAKRIIADFHSPAEAEAAEENWAKQFQKDEVPENLEEVEIDAAEVGTITDGTANIKIDKVIARAGLAESNSDAQRKIKAGSSKSTAKPTRSSSCKQRSRRESLPRRPQNEKSPPQVVRVPHRRRGFAAQVGRQRNIGPCRRRSILFHVRPQNPRRIRQRRNSHSRAHPLARQFRHAQLYQRSRSLTTLSRRRRPPRNRLPRSPRTARRPPHRLVPPQRLSRRKRRAAPHRTVNSLPYNRTLSPMHEASPVRAIPCPAPRPVRRPRRAGLARALPPRPMVAASARRCRFRARRSRSRDDAPP